jgi:hypothetical protein
LVSDIPAWEGKMANLFYNLEKGSKERGTMNTRLVRKKGKEKRIEKSTKRQRKL